MPDTDMLAFTYRIRKIMRDMKHTHLSGEEAQAKRDAVIETLAGVCEKIEQDFS